MKILRDVEGTFYDSYRIQGLESRCGPCIFINTNPVVSDSGATLKFQFSSLKNTSHTDFQLNFSTPGILVAIRSTGKKLQEYITGVNGFQKFLCVVDLHEKTDF